MQEVLDLERLLLEIVFTITTMAITLFLSL